MQYCGLIKALPCRLFKIVGKQRGYIGKIILQGYRSLHLSVKCQNRDFFSSGIFRLLLMAAQASFILNATRFPHSFKDTCNFKYLHTFKFKLFV